MPHHDLIEVAGRITDVFAHRFVLELAEGHRILADLGPKGAEAYRLKRGTDVVAAGEMKPSELKVARIGTRGDAPTIIEHKPRHEPNRESSGDDMRAEPDAAMQAVKTAGIEPVGQPRRKPKHFEVLGRRGTSYVECHVEFDGHIRKEKPVVPHDDKWAADINA